MDDGGIGTCLGLYTLKAIRPPSNPKTASMTRLAMNWNMSDTKVTPLSIDSSIALRASSGKLRFIFCIISAMNFPMIFPKRARKITESIVPKIAPKTPARAPIPMQSPDVKGGVSGVKLFL